jgi:Uma2 family endonuclease
VEHPLNDEPDLLEEADRISDRLPGYRVEIIGGVIIVSPPADGPHAQVLTDLTLAFRALHGERTRLLQAVGVWLPDGPSDFAIPDLSIVDADFCEHEAEYNCYDPAVFRLVLEVTSSNYRNDLRTKVAAYANAKIPVYLIVDRKNERIHLLTEPTANGYATHRVFAPGERLTLPDSVGAEVELAVDALLTAGRR